MTRFGFVAENALCTQAFAKIGPVFRQSSLALWSVIIET